MKHDAADVFQFRPLVLRYQSIEMIKFVKRYINEHSGCNILCLTGSYLCRYSRALIARNAWQKAQCEPPDHVYFAV